ncbi:methyltransferase domain-containing protein [Bacillus subtilis]|uniref:methyltransferase domain-containing protein n=1 Tax=Bacillus subtilis TaxID=1423 RepID=UPI00292DFAA0|nr:methyltransferase domain-containing protein [Bacillus subtilis]WOA23154.1 50S ribosomal protein L11 methyltransferase [Bacillus subtilis]
METKQTSSGAKNTSTTSSETSTKPSPPDCSIRLTQSKQKAFQDKALEYAELQGEETVIDAYCGIGTISLSSWQSRRKKCTVLKLKPEAIEDAKRNAKLNGITNAEFAVGEAETVIQSGMKKVSRPMNSKS